MAASPPRAQSYPVPSATPPRRKRVNWLRVAIVGLLGGLLITGGLAALGGVGKGFNTAGAFGVPDDFPRYPAAIMLGVHENFTPGLTTVNASWDADASLDSVTAYYSTKLNQPPWTVTRMDTVDGTWAFRRTDGKMTGLIRLSGHGQRTRIDIRLEK